MNSRERVLSALSCKTPDKVPYVYSVIHTSLQEEILGKKLKNYIYDLRFEPSLIAKPSEKMTPKLNYCVHPETADKLKLDAIGFRIMPPIFAKTRFSNKGGHGVEKGLIDSWQAFKQIQMPDPDNAEIYQEAADFVQKFQGKYAIFCGIRLGVSPVLLSMGYDNFSYKLYEDRELIKAMIKLYADWNKKVIKNLMEIGVDFLWSFDDLAYKNGPLFSPQVWRELFLPILKQTTKKINIPWLFHSDGNLMPILDDLLPLGMSGIHPLEPGTMDLKSLKENYGKRLCLVGNIDIDKYLTKANVKEVEVEVKNKINLLGRNGGYIISDSNSVPYFCKAENVIAMSKAVQKYRSIY